MYIMSGKKVARMVLLPCQENLLTRMAVRWRATFLWTLY